MNRRKQLLAHLAVPAVVAVVGLVIGLVRGPVDFSSVVAYSTGGLVFYAAPHLLWTLIAARNGITGVLWHAGFLAASAALVAIGLLSLFGGRDPSGLPMQWMLYWPLAVVPQFLIAVGSAIYKWIHA
jgi:hypothetical protein